MLASFLLSLREGLEAALIIGIVLGVLLKIKRTDLNGVIWRGVGLAVLLSFFAAIALNLLGMEFEGKGEEIFEGVAMLLAAGVLTWMILWMQNHGCSLKGEIEEKKLIWRHWGMDRGLCLRWHFWQCSEKVLNWHYSCWLQG